MNFTRSLLFIIGLLHPFDVFAISPCAKALGPLQVNQALVDPAKMSYSLTEGPANARTIVLIHGLGSRLSTFTKVTPLFKQKYRVLSIDQRGHGRTPLISDNFTPEVMARDLAGLLDHLGIQRATILGHSLGARTAAAFAGLFPERTEGLIVEDMELQSRPRKNWRHYYSQLEVAKQLPLTYPSREAARLALIPIYGDEEAESLSRGALHLRDGRVRLKTHPYAHLLYRLHGNDADVRDHVHRYDGPILVLIAEKHSAVSSEGLRIFREEFPTAAVETIMGSGHSIHRTRRAAFVASVLRFMDQIGNVQNDYFGR